jgi:hypothetical protein
MRGHNGLMWCEDTHKRTQTSMYIHEYADYLYTYSFIYILIHLCTCNTCIHYACTCIHTYKLYIHNMYTYTHTPYIHNTYINTYAHEDIALGHAYITCIDTHTHTHHAYITHTYIHNHIHTLVKILLLETRGLLMSALTSHIMKNIGKKKGIPTLVPIRVSVCVMYVYVYVCVCYVCIENIDET